MPGAGHFQRGRPAADGSAYQHVRATALGYTDTRARIPVG
jgi:hypothetical protein